MSKLRCEAYRSVWIEVPEDDGDYECPECGGTISVDDDGAEHEGIEWVKCPINPGCSALVFPSDDDEYECPHCEGAILVEGDEARHERVEDVECPLNEGEITTVALGADGTVDCDHCGMDIEVKGGEAEHAEADPGSIVLAEADGVRKDDLEKIVRQESRVREKVDRLPGRFEKMGNRVLLLFEMVKNCVTGEYTEVPWKSIAVAVAALAYVVKPVDPIPGPFDEAVIINIAVEFIEADLRDYCRFKGYPLRQYF